MNDWSQWHSQLVLSTGTTALSRPWLATQGLPARAPSSPPSPWNLTQAPPRRLGDGDGKTDPCDGSLERFHRRICWDPPQLDCCPLPIYPTNLLPTNKQANKQTEPRNPGPLKAPSPSEFPLTWFFEKKYPKNLNQVSELIRPPFFSLVSSRRNQDPEAAAL